MKRYKTLANQNLTILSKIYIKLEGKGQKNHCSDICTIMKGTVGVIIDPSDILGVQGISGERANIQLVIAKFIYSKTKVKDIKYR